MPATSLHVSLLTVTPEAEALIYAACKSCTSSDGAADVFPLASNTDNESYSDHTKMAQEVLIRRVIDSGHTSVVEHVSFTFAVAGVSRALSHQLVRHRIASYCLSGDTVVVAYKGKTRTRSKRWTMKQLYEMSNNTKARSRLMMIRLRSVNDNGIIIPNKIKSIVYSGAQNVYMVTTKSGRSIKATIKHRFKTKDGYVPLGNLVVGDKVICNGLPAYKNPEWIRQHYLIENKERKAVASMAGVSEACLGKWIRKFGLQKPHNSRPNRRAGHGVPGMFSDESLNLLSEIKSGQRNPQWKGDQATAQAGRQRCQRLYPVGKCDACESDGKRIERHHLNKNTLDNSPGNVARLCQQCHKAFHFGQAVLAVFSDEIVSIENVGVEDTYDIEMESPWHNFVAEGFVVHNSQQSQRYVKADGFEYIMPPSILKNLEANNHYCNMMEFINQTYEHLRKNHGIPAEDARFVLPNACETKIVVTMNCRALLNFFEERCCQRAQWEIRALANEMLNICKNCLPVVFTNAGPKCIRQGYCTEHKSCGRFPKKVNNAL